MNPKADAAAKTAPASTSGAPATTIDDLRQRLHGKRGAQYWRSLEELARTDEFGEVLEREFPQHAALWDEGIDRRRFLQLSGASLALAGLSSCGYQPVEDIIPYVEQPEQMVPGKPLYFASATTAVGYATGILVETHMGRPTKIEGNPDHPSSLGATSAQTQAAILDLYDPDRSQVLKRLGRVVTWEEFSVKLERLVRAHRALGGEGLCVLMRPTTSPTLSRQLRTLEAELPKMKLHTYEPASCAHAHAGAMAAFGKHVDTRYDLKRADLIVTLDADLLGSLPGHVRYAREFAARRRPNEVRPGMNRLYSIESCPTVTGSIADHRLSLSASRIEILALALAHALRVPGAAEVPDELLETLRHGTAGATDGDQHVDIDTWIKILADDLRSHAGRSLIVAGESLSPEVHALVHAINDVLGAVGHTLVHTAPVRELDGRTPSIDTLASDMHAGKVDTLLILDANPVFDAPADLDFAAAMEKVRTRIHHGLYEDETAALCQWHIPATHDLEGWSDARAHDGTASIVQPMIAPLYDGHTSHELIEALSIAGTDAAPRSAIELVRETWREYHTTASATRGAAATENDYELFWRQSLHDGVIADTRYPELRVFPVEGLVRRSVLALERALLADDSDAHDEGDAHARGDGDARLELNFRVDPSIHDGRFANNGWLQELPKPWTRLTWDNALLISPRTAAAHRLANEDVVLVTIAGETERSLRVPVWILPGHAELSATLHLGYGRWRGGKVADDTGINVYPIRTTEHPWRVRVSIAATGATSPLACTQDHWSMEGRHLARHGTLDEYRRDPRFAHHNAHTPLDISMFPPHAYDDHAWGMAIDLGSCIGCNACVAACNAENNLPVVGKEQVSKAREMHWIRIDRYFEGDIDDPGIAHQPVMCQHCENAPCEQVCPVAATVHSAEGLNDMVYNRCVGTRYCSNNCPYKVRRFNFLQYQDNDSPSLKLMRNPDVTVRSRGVMEKCTYCVQRISHARIDSRRNDTKIDDETLQSACQQACPTQAIVFGDINDPESQVAKRKADPRNYTILDELNVKPRTSYMAGVRNPNPALLPPDTGRRSDHVEG